ncbi:MAG: hypothetical protein CME59_08570 [Halioglobus sp.]|nr:hypothetical protein [Halioglobus sp.]|tara:strand:+ start:1260 stop:1667 length:408 start_codon:yes stop_codon:yes gene_type:complete
MKWLIALVVLAAGIAFVLSRRRDADASDDGAVPAAPAQPATADTPTQDPVRRGVRLFMQEQYAEAFALLQEPAHQGNLKAQQLLAKMYYAGNGVARDEEQYLYWLKQAAANGDKPSRAKVKKIEAARARASAVDG